MYFKNKINLAFSNILHLLPSSDKQLPFEIIHGLCIVLTLTLMHTLNLYLRLNYYYKWVRSLEELLDIFIHSVMTLTNVNTVIISTFFCKAAWINLYSDARTQYVDRFSSDKSNLYFVLLLVLYITQTTSEFLFYKRYSYGVIVYLIPGFVNIFLLLINSLNIYYFANKLKDMLVTCQINLQQEKQKLLKIQQSNTNPDIVSQVFSKISKMDEHLQYFLSMCKKINSFNKIYGLQILLFATVFLLFAYENLNIALKEGFNHPKQFEAHLKLSLIKLLKCCSLLVIMFSQCVFLLC